MNLNTSDLLNQTVVWGRNSSSGIHSPRQSLHSSATPALTSNINTRCTYSTKLKSKSYLVLKLFIFRT